MICNAGCEISIIICTRNRAKDLVQTLTSFQGLYVPNGLQCELVIVDNASEDGTAKIVQEFQPPYLPTRYIYEPRLGKGHAYNAATASARGKVLLFTDDDVRLPANWIEGMSSPILLGHADALAGGVKIASHLQRPWMRQLHREWLASTDYIDCNNPQAMVGANMAFSRDVLSKVPLFDTELGPGALGFSDETLFCWQLQEAGYKIGSALETIVEHHFDPVRLSRSSFISTATKLGRSTAYLLHHWEHKVVDNAGRHLAEITARAACQNLKRWKSSPSSEGLQEWEMYQTVKMHTYKQYLIERRRPRNYELRGLVKKSCW